MLSATDQPARSQTQKGATKSAITIVDARFQELAQGYMQWRHRHPEATRQAPQEIPDPRQDVPRRDPASDSQPPPLIVRMPSIDLYSPSGFSVYHGAVSKENAAFIIALPRDIPRGDATTPHEVRPTLQEAVEMFPEF
jgi:hypothetical protein